MFYQLIIFCSIFVIWILWHKKQSNSEPPELSGKLPIIGHTHKLLGDSKKLFKYVQNFSEECLEKGGVVTINFGPRKAYIIADPEDCLTVANACLNKHNMYDFAKIFAGDGLITANASLWKKNRRLLQPAFNQQVLDSYIEVFNKQAQEIVHKLRKEIGKPFDHEELFRRNSVEIICLTSFGVDNEVFQNLLHQYLYGAHIFLKSLVERSQKFWLYSDFIYNMTQHKKSLEMELHKLFDLSRSIIQRKKLDRESKINTEATSGKFKSFIDLLLELAYDTGCISDKQILDETNTIIGAGHDTTATTLVLALTILGSRTQLQEKTYDEIIHCLGHSKRNIDKNDLSQLVYLEAVLNETMRLYSILPLLGRRALTDVKLKNYTIKANSDCLISVYGLHRHSIWGPDAERFRPERWLDKETLPDQKYFGAFGLGRRACIGKKYAMMTMKITLAHILRKYEIKSNIDDLVLQFHMVAKVESGHYIAITERKQI